MTKKLNDFRVGERGYVSAVTGQGAIKRRLFDMGVTPGTEIILRKCAPFGDPIEISLRDYQLSIRKSEAALVLMTASGENKYESA